mmetsp:Transcript_8125/g.35914  ORF Transcript_8125/g.35914 Transcript_8125/m.35914 type:complete len:274 (+) Transcript_8125:202-1023(+)
MTPPGGPGDAVVVVVVTSTACVVVNAMASTRAREGVAAHARAKPAGGATTSPPAGSNFSNSRPTRSVTSAGGATTSPSAREHTSNTPPSVPRHTALSGDHAAAVTDPGATPADLVSKLTTRVVSLSHARSMAWIVAAGLALSGPSGSCVTSRSWALNGLNAIDTASACSGDVATSSSGASDRRTLRRRSGAVDASARSLPSREKASALIPTLAPHSSREPSAVRSARACTCTAGAPGPLVAYASIPPFAGLVAKHEIPVPAPARKRAVRALAS